MSKHWCRLLAAISVLLFQPTYGTAHPYHTSLAEAEINRQSGRLEVALQVTPEDLDQALSAMTGKTVKIDTTPDVDKLIVKYLSSRFTVTAADKTSKRQATDAKRPPKQHKPHRPQPVVLWVGKQVSAKAAWLYFELPLPQRLDQKRSGMEQVIVNNQIFFDRAQKQTNTIVLTDGRRKKTIVCTRDKRQESAASSKGRRKPTLPAATPDSGR